jgi:hypothetical protein
MLQSALNSPRLPCQLVTLRAPHLLTRALDRFFTGPMGEDFRRVLGSLPSVYETYVVGGVVRDLLLGQLRMIHKPIRDIDLVVQGAPDREVLEHLLSDFNFRTNRMGGLKFRASSEGVYFDLWRIEDQVELSSSSGPPYTVEQLLRHFLLDIDAVAWNPRTGDLYDYGCLRAITAGAIDLVGAEGISVSRASVQAAHILLISYDTGFTVSKQARELVRETWRSGKQEEVLAVLEDKRLGATHALRDHIKELLGYFSAEEQ